MSQIYTYPFYDVSVTPDPGAATAANQVLEIAELTDINTKTLAAGQAAMAASSPVVIASDQSAIPVTMAAVPTGGATAANQVLEIAELTDINTKTLAAGQAAMVASSPVVIASDQSAIPVTMAAVPTGGATAANQVLEITALDSIDTKTPALVTGRVPVDGSGVTQPVSGTVTANAGTGTFAVSAASLPLPAGAATETTLAAASAKLPATLGQKAMAASMAVVLASDQASVPVAATPVVPTALTVKSAGISVGTSAVRLTTDGSAPSATRRVLMANVDTANTSKFYIGPSGVTAANGVILVAGQTFAAENDAGDYYIISNAAAQTVFVTEQE